MKGPEMVSYPAEPYPAYHPAFTLPSDPSARIWRYLDLAKLLRCIQTRRLFFARADRLGDPFEGSYPSANREARVQTLEGYGVKPTAERLSATSEAARRRRDEMYVSCWHMNEAESAAMWSLYGKDSTAVAICSTARRLMEVCNAFILPVFIGMVRYADYDSETVSESNAFHAVMTKRLSFRHEAELRAVTMIAEHANIRAHLLSDISADGVNVPVDIRTLVDRIVVGPGAPEWFAMTVRRAIADSGFSDLVVEHSRLGDEPYF